MSEDLDLRRKRAIALARLRAQEQMTHPARPQEPQQEFKGPPPGSYYNPETGQIMDPALKPMSRGEAAAAGTSSGVMFGAEDEALGNIAPGGREQVRVRSDMAREQYPWTYGLSEVGGAVAGTLGAGRLLSPALRAAGAAAAPATAGSAARLGAGAGAAEGTLYGFNTGEGGPGSRAENAVRTGVLGAGVGAAAPSVTSAAQGLTRMATDPISNVAYSLAGRPNPANAARTIGRVVQRSGRSADELSDDLTTAAREGQPEYVLADAAGHPGQRALSGVARQPGDYRKRVVDYLNQRQAGQGDRLSSFTAEALDAPDTAAQRRATMTTARDDAADLAFSRARGNAAPVDVRDAVSAIDERISGIVDSGVDLDGIDKKLLGFKKRLAVPEAKLPEGTSAKELSDFDRVFQVRRDVADAYGEAIRAGRGNEARYLKKLRDRLDNALQDSSERYRKAMQDYSRESKAIEAIETGERATSGRARSEDVVAQWRRMSPEQKRAFRAGYADPRIAKIDQSAEGVNKARDFRRPKARREMEAMANDPALFNRRVGREDVMHETRRQATGGSQTAENLADQADVSGPGGYLLRAAGDIGNLHFGSAASNVGAALGPFAKGQNEATRAMIAEALMSRDPQKALAKAMRQSQKDVATQQVIEALMRQGAIRNLP